MTRSRPLFGTASAGFAVLTFFVPVLIFFIAGASGAAAQQHPDDPSSAWAPLITLLAGLVVGAYATVVTALGGVMAGVIALVRGERASWLAVVGLTWCGAVVVFFAWLGVLR
jgi:hypothetical protein